MCISMEQAGKQTELPITVPDWTEQEKIGSLVQKFDQINTNFAPI